MSTLPARPTIRSRQDLTPSQLAEVCSTLLEQKDEASLYRAGVEKLAAIVGWERLPDPRHLIHELLGRTDPSSERPIIGTTPMEGWLLDFAMRTHEPMSSTPRNADLTVWDEYSLDFGDPAEPGSSAEFRTSLIRTLSGDRTELLEAHVSSIWEAEESTAGKISETPVLSTERLRSGTRGKIDLLLYPPPRMQNGKESAVINAILLKEYTGCPWEMLTSAPEPWTVTPADAETAKRWSEDGIWEKKKKTLHLVKYKNEERKPDEPFILPFPERRRQSEEVKRPL